MSLLLPIRVSDGGVPALQVDSCTISRRQNVLPRSVGNARITIEDKVLSSQDTWHTFQWTDEHAVELGQWNPSWVEGGLNHLNLCDAQTDLKMRPDSAGICEVEYINHPRVLGKASSSGGASCCENMDQTDFLSSSAVLAHLLQRCIDEKDLAAGREVHCLIVRSGRQMDNFLGSHLIHMFASLDSLLEASLVFVRLPMPSVYSWNAIISAHAKIGQNEQAFKLYYQMQNSSVEPNGHVFVAVLQACACRESLIQGKLIHAHVIELGLESDVYVGNALVDVFARNGSLGDACKVFKRLPFRDVVTWNSLIGGYTQNGHGQQALCLFQQMEQEGLKPNKVTFLCILKACTSIAALEAGGWIHSHILENGLESDIFVGSTLIDMYGKCGSLEDARAVFDNLSKPGVVPWNAMIAVYACNGHGQESLKLFQKMQQEGVDPNKVTFVCILKACSNTAALEYGRKINSHIISCGLESDLFVGNTIIDMYGKCGSLEDAQMVFDRLRKRDVVTWSAMIGAYAQHSDYQSALQCFKHMQQTGLKPNDVTFLSLLSACSLVGRVDEGCLHFKAMTMDYSITPMLEHYTCLIDLLGQAGYLNEAEDLLESMPLRSGTVGWTCLLGSCRTHGIVELAKRCFDYVVTMNSGNGAGYLFMSTIYAHACMSEHADRVKELRKQANAWKKPAKAFIEVDNQVHGFIVADKTHPHSQQIYQKLKALSMKMREEGHIQCPNLLDEGKEDDLFVHCEKLAIAFGLLSTPRGFTIRIAKNLRMCEDCHVDTKIMSKIEMREIVVKDSYRIHHFKDGLCSCKGYC